MPYVTCTFCGKSGIQALDIGVCSTCLKRDDDRIRVLAIKKYLELYPEAKLTEVSKELGIKMEIIDRLIDEGSLQMYYDENGVKKIVNDTREVNQAELQRRKTLQKMAEVRAQQRRVGDAPYIGNSKLVKDLKHRKNDFGDEER